MKPGRSFFERTDSRAVGFSVLALALFQVLLSLGLIGITEMEPLFTAWDAEHYEEIAQFGYKDHWLTAFFPGFPFVWGILDVSPILISAINQCVWLIVVLFISRELKLKVYEGLLALVLPSAIFFALPYSESLFAFASLIIILGYRKDSVWLIALGFILANLIRPAGSIFIPAAILVELLLPSQGKNKLLRISVFTLANLIGALAALSVHSFYGWDFGATFEAQAKWGNELQVPLIPFKSWGGDWNSRFDGLVLLYSILLGVLLTIDWVRSKRLVISRYELFSILYVLGITASVVLFRGGSLFSLNRFVFCTLMGYITLIWLVNHPDLRLRNIAWIGLGSLVLFLGLFFAFNHIQNLLGYALFSLILMIVLYLFSGVITRWRTFRSVAGLIVLMVFYQLCYYLFLSETWIA